MTNLYTHAAIVALATLGAIVGASNASAQEATPDTWISEAKSTLSRAEVMAARAPAVVGWSHPIEMTFVNVAGVPLTRTQVLAELALARASGEYDVINAEAMLFIPARSRTFYALRQEN